MVEKVGKITLNLEKYSDKFHPAYKNVIVNIYLLVN